MRKILVAVLLLFCGAVSISVAGSKDFVTAKLTDVRAERTDAGAARAQFSYCLAFDLSDHTYLVFYLGTWRHSYEPTDIAVGDPVPVRLAGSNMDIQTPRGKTIKAHIIRNERNQAGQPHANCALAVSGSK